MPLRKCQGCGEVKESSEMIKITRIHGFRNIKINPDSINFGRSAYVCYNKNCIQNAIKKKKLQKSLKLEIPQEIFEQLKNLSGIN